MLYNVYQINKLPQTDSKLINYQLNILIYNVYQINKLPQNDSNLLINCKKIINAF